MHFGNGVGQRLSALSKKSEEGFGPLAFSVDSGDVPGNLSSCLQYRQTAMCTSRNHK